MRQLKITKSITNRGAGHIIEHLKSKNFNLDEFIKKIAETVPLIEREERFLLYVFQDFTPGWGWGCRIPLNRVKQMSEEEHAAYIYETYEGCYEINQIRWLNAYRVIAITKEYENSGKPIQELLLAAMQGVKNAAFAYTFSPKASFGDFAAPIIRRHIEQYLQTGESSFAELYREHKEILDNAKEAYNEYRNPKCEVMYSVMPEKGRIHLFANSKISRCHKEIRMAADYVEWRQVDAATHLPDDYDERDKFIRTGAFTLHDTLYNGECKDIVKSVTDGEWYICTVPDGTRVPVRELTDRDSMRGALEVLLEILKKTPERRILKFDDWRAENGI